MQSSNPTECPTWCTDHQSHAQDYAGQLLRFDTHSGDVFAIWPQIGDSWLFWLQLSRVDVSPTVARRTAPTITLSVGQGQVPRALSPADARGLAAALVECAEVVEAALTGACTRCGRAVDPVDVDGCLECRAASPRLQLVPDGEGER